MKNLDLVYIAAPYAHEDKMVMNIRYEIINKLCSKIILRYGCSIFSPISHGHVMNLNIRNEDIGFDNRNYWLDMDLKILKNCSNMFVLMLDGWKDSKGILEEIKFCKTHSIEISFIDIHEILGIQEISEISRSLLDSETKLDILQYVVGEWAEETFKESSPESILEHLGDEITELKSANKALQIALHMNSKDDIPDKSLCDRSGVSLESADILILLLHYCHKRDIDLGKFTLEKFEINRNRKWSKEKNEKGYFSHIKE